MDDTARAIRDSGFGVSTFAPTLGKRQRRHHRRRRLSVVVVVVETRLKAQKTQQQKSSWGGTLSLSFGVSSKKVSLSLSHQLMPLGIL